MLYQVHPTLKTNRTRRAGADKTTPEEGGSIDIPAYRRVDRVSPVVGN